MKNKRLFYVVFIALVPFLITFFIYAYADAGGTPIPTIVGPIPVTSTSHPFNSMHYAIVPIDLTALGYVEEEYFVSGFANVYELNNDDFSLQVVTPNVPYTTRILVIRPAKPRRFSGNVIVEPIHTANAGSYPIWGNSHDFFLARGDAYILITQPTTIPSLKIWDPERYSPLSAPAVTCGLSESAPEVGLLWDFISQIGALLRNNGPTSPLYDFSIKHLYATGFSQTGTLITTYVNFIHPMAIVDSGQPIYNGYIIGGAGMPAKISQCATELPVGDPRTFIAPRGVPVFRVMTQADFNYSSWFSTRREDSDTYPDVFRLYEIPGATHFAVYPRLSFPNASELARLGLTPSVINCTPPAKPNDFPYNYLLNGAFTNLDRWVRKGIPAPKEDRIGVNIDGSTVLDEFGNAVGGVRTPYVDVPTVTYDPLMNPVVNCEVPLSDVLLGELYPTHGKYVRGVVRNTKKLRKNLWVIRGDAKKIKTEAAHMDVP